MVGITFLLFLCHFPNESNPYPQRHTTQCFLHVCGSRERDRSEGILLGARALQRMFSCTALFDPREYPANHVLSDAGSIRRRSPSASSLAPSGGQRDIRKLV